MREQELLFVPDELSLQQDPSFFSMKIFGSWDYSLEGRQLLSKINQC